jgi:hypothetical protein
VTFYAAKGSQRWLQIAVHKSPQALDSALRQAGVIGDLATVRWVSPDAKDGFVEYRDGAALEALEIDQPLARSLADFWPSGGPVWDGLGVCSDGCKVLVEAKAHIAEAASPASKASEASLARIEAALHEARAWYAPRAGAAWSKALYQYANRLAFHYFLFKVNNVPSRLVFLDFCNAEDVGGPDCIDKWKGATEMIHALLGLPKDLRSKGVFHAYVDVRELQSLAH